MIVDRHTAHLIVTGAILEHRLPARPGPPSRAVPRRDRVLAVNAPAGRRGEVLVTACTRSGDGGHLATLTDDALARLSGDGDLAGWVRRWLFERDTAWLARRCPAGVIWYSTLDAAGAALAELDDGPLLERFERRWAREPVWVVRWEPVQDPPVYLAQTGGTEYRWDGSLRRWLVDGRIPDGLPDAVGDGLADRGYTSRPDLALETIEVVDVERLRPHWRDDAAKRHRAQRDRRAEAARLALELRSAD